MSPTPQPHPPPAWEKLGFTQDLDPAHIDKLARIASPVEWKAGAIVYREGDPASPLYVVEEGRVALEMTVPGRAPVTILTVGPGEIFGWSSLFYLRPKTSAARALVPSRALALDAAGFRALCDADPVFGYALTRRILQVVSERLKAARIQLLDVFGS
jgi:CRP-like cAMP-binding protein